MKNLRPLPKPLLCHFLLCIIGLIGIVQLIAGKIGLLFEAHLNNWISYSDAYLLVVSHSKIASLLQYITVIITLFVYSIVVSLSVSKLKLMVLNVFFRKNEFTKLYCFYLAFLLLFNICIYCTLSDNPIECLFAGVGWLIVTMWPLSPLVKRVLIMFGTKTSKSLQWSAYGLLVAIVIQMLYMFLPFIGSEQLKVINDYFSVPEKTQLTNMLVDNKTYIASHHVGGLFTTIKSINIVENPLVDFSKLAESSSLETLLCKYLTTVQCKQLFYDKTLPGLNKHNYSVEEKLFMQENSYEISWQLIAGHYFHHQNALLAPLNEYVLGKPVEDIVFLYGYGNSLLLKQVVSYLGEFNFQTIEKFFYSFYPLYYGCFVLLAWFIFGNVWWVLLATLLSYSALQNIGFEAIRYAPGFNPLRHLLDIFIIGTFYQYLRTKRLAIAYLVLSFALALLAIFASKEFGSILFVALSLAYIANYLLVKRAKLELLLFLGMMGLAIGMMFFLKNHLGADSLAIYGILGVSVTPTSQVITRCIPLILVAIYAFFSYAYLQKEAKKPWFCLSLLLFFYLQGTLIYYIWYTEPSHLLSINVAWVLLIALLFRQVLSYSTSREFNLGLLKTTTFVALLVFYLPSLGFYYKSLCAYNKVFKTHQLYQWNFPRAHFISTMDPKPFINSVQLIDHYSSASAIYLLSRYDNFLPFLAARYSALPFSQLDLSIVSKKEFDLVVTTLQQTKPRYLFVDNDIEQVHFDDILNPQDSFAVSLGALSEKYEQSLGRVLILNNLKLVFDVIKVNYKPITKGDMITVYERITP